MQSFVAKAKAEQTWRRIFAPLFYWRSFPTLQNYASFTLDTIVLISLFGAKIQTTFISAKLHSKGKANTKEYFVLLFYWRSFSTLQIDASSNAWIVKKTFRRENSKTSGTNLQQLSSMETISCFIARKFKVSKFNSLKFKLHTIPFLARKFKGTKEYILFMFEAVKLESIVSQSHSFVV